MQIFEYRIVELTTVPTEEGLEPYKSFMPQRGVPGQIDGMSQKMYWRDGVPMAAPTRELADAYVRSMQEFDLRETPGRIVWISE